MMGQQNGDPFAAFIKNSIYRGKGRGRDVNGDRQWSRQAADKRYQEAGRDQGRQQTNTVQ